MPPILTVNDVSKSFVMHQRGGVRIPVVSNVSLAVNSGECVALGGPSGAGKSSILKMVFGNYEADGGQIQIAKGEHQIDVAKADPRAILRLRRDTVGYVSQFLRVVPRVSTREIVAEPLIVNGGRRDDAFAQAEFLLRRLNIPQRLWDLPPATFSGGEQQRINVARGFIVDYPLLLLDEPTASLDAENRQVVTELMLAKKLGGTGLLGIFHDAVTRDAVADRIVDVSKFSHKRGAA
jgi:alpha-D-ribose 1-methylphosphonate 5-triphosphate synthase subunit PhnL